MSLPDYFKPRMLINVTLFIILRFGEKKNNKLSAIKERNTAS